jgi:3-methyladenine DNA glycosylase AlkD
MTLSDVMTELESLGNAQTKKTFLRHGAREPFFGVRVADLKTIQKRIKKNHELALQLYDTGNSDAMYLAAMIAEPQKMTKAQLQKWMKGAYWYMISEFSVPWTAAESRFAVELALTWMKSKQELISAAGWATYGSFVAITADDELNLDEIVELLESIPTMIDAAPNRAKYAMNNFVIAVGSYVTMLNAKAKAIAKQVGKVEVDMGDTSCSVPDALEKMC